MNNNKLIYVEYLRVISMLFIIFYHCLCYYTNRWSYESPHIHMYDTIAGTIHGIALPMFVFISGLLYSFLRDKGKYSKYSLFLKNKALRLLFPMGIWSIFCVLVIPHASWEELKDGGYKHLWFLGMLFWLFFVAPCLQKISEGSLFKNILMIALFCLISCLFYKRPFSNLPLFLSNAGTYVFAFFAGIWKGKNRDINLINKRENMFLMVTFVFYSFTYIAPPFNHLVDNLLLLLRLLTSVTLCLLVLQKVEKLNLTESVLLKKLSMCSMGIYIIHHILIEILLSLPNARDLMDVHVVVGPLVLFFVVIICSYIITSMLLSNKYLSKIV